MVNSSISAASPSADSRFDLVARHFAALGSACILLVGRWSFNRLNLQNLDLSWIPSLRALGVIFLALLTVYYVVKKPQVSRNSYIIPLVAFLGWMAITALWSLRPEAANEKLADIALLGVFLASFYQLATRIGTERFLTLFTRYFLLLLCLLAFLALQKITFDADANVGPTSRKVFVLGSGPNVFGRNMALLTLILLIQMKRGWLTPLSIGVAGISTFLVLLTGSRGALLELFIGLLLTLIFIKRSAWLRIAIPPLLLVPLASTAVFEYLIDGPPDSSVQEPAENGLGEEIDGPPDSSVQEPAENSLGEEIDGPPDSSVQEPAENSLWKEVLDVQESRVVRHTIENFHDSSRTDLIAAAFHMGMDNPIGGAGLGSYQWVNPAKTVVLHYPHNLVAEAWAEGGSIGLILLLVVGIRFAWRFLATIRSTWGLLSASVLVSGIFSMVSGDIYDSRVLMCFALAWMLKHESIPLTPRAEEVGKPPPQ